MATKPTPGGSDGTYGTELNAFLDESLASDGKIKTEALQTDATAPVADAAVANKKYVDDVVAANVPVGDNPTANDSESNAMLKAHAYLAQTMGFVTAIMTRSDDGQHIRGFVGTTNDPAGAGTKVQDETTFGTAGDTHSISFLVANGKYFEITDGSSNVTAINWTPLISGGSAPIDQD